MELPFCIALCQNLLHHPFFLMWIRSLPWGDFAATGDDDGRRVSSTVAAPMAAGGAVTILKKTSSP